MKTRMNGIKAALLALAAAVLLPGCSNMIQDLRIRVFNIISAELENPSNILTVTVTGDIPPGTIPTVTYVLPDGTEVTVEGTVTDNPDGTQTLTFDLNPVPSGLPGGALPVTINVPGYAPETTTVIYTPPVTISVQSGGTEVCDNDEIFIPQTGGTIEKPEVITNYREDDIIIEETYTDKNGDPIPDEDGDGDVDWEDVQRWLTKDEDDDGIPDNAEEPVEVIPEEEIQPEEPKAE